MSSSKKSNIWIYFSAEPRDVKAKCKKCKADISRGGKDPKSFTTSGLKNHLKNKHPTLFKELTSKDEKDKDDEASSSTAHKAMQSFMPKNQPTLADSFENLKVWDINSTKARAVHRLIGEMIAVDMQPFSVVDDRGFSRVVNHLEPRYKIPSRKYFTENVIPEINVDVRAAISQHLTSFDAGMSFTTDIWTSDSNNEAFMSLTVHGIDPNWDRKQYILCNKYFPDRHTSENIAEVIRRMLDDWSVDHDAVQAILRDNGANVVKGVRDAGLRGYSCAAHTLALALNDAIFDQVAIQNIVKLASGMVGHFNRSASAMAKLKQLQIQEGVQQQKLLQYVQTRWNSIYLMLKSIRTNKKPLILFAADNAIEVFTANQWALIETLLEVLEPFDQLTSNWSADSATVSTVLPGITGLVGLIKNYESRGIQTMKNGLLDAINKLFKPWKEDILSCVAQVLDPRFKLTCIPKERHVDAKSHLLSQAQSSSHSSPARPEPEPAEPAVATASATSDDYEPPSSKSQKTDLWDLYDSAASSMDAQPAVTGNLLSVANELEDYLREPRMDRKQDPLLWWRLNASRFPTLAPIARRYLSTPATSVRSERLFSSAGNIVTPLRNRLTPENVERLVFLHDNLIALNFVY